MSNFISKLEYASESFLKFSKEANKRGTMTPKEYGMMLKKKCRKGKRNDR